MKNKAKYEAIRSRILIKNFPDSNYFQKAKTIQQTKNNIEISQTVRIVFIHPDCSYYQYRNHIVGKLMRVVEIVEGRSGYYSFVNDDNRKALNKACGYSDNKKEYRFHLPKIG